MTKNKLFILDIPLYFQEIVFVTGYSDDELLEIFPKELKKIGIKSAKQMADFIHPLLETSKSSLGRTVLYENGGLAIRLYEKIDPHSAEGVSVLAHEVVHACSFIFERIGMPHNIDTDEAYAYLTGFIIKSFYDKI